MMPTTTKADSSRNIRMARSSSSSSLSLASPLVPILLSLLFATIASPPGQVAAIQLLYTEVHVYSVTAINPGKLSSWLTFLSDGRLFHVGQSQPYILEDHLSEAKISAMLPGQRRQLMKGVASRVETIAVSSLDVCRKVAFITHKWATSKEGKISKLVYSVVLLERDNSEHEAEVEASLAHISEASGGAYLTKEVSQSLREEVVGYLRFFHPASGLYAGLSFFTTRYSSGAVIDAPLFAADVEKAARQHCALLNAKWKVATEGLKRCEATPLFNLKPLQQSCHFQTKELRDGLVWDVELATAEEWEDDDDVTMVDSLPTLGRKGSSTS